MSQGTRPELSEQTSVQTSLREQATTNRLMPDQIDALSSRRSFDLLWEHKLYNYINMESPVELIKKQIKNSIGSYDPYETNSESLKANDELFLKTVKILSDLYQGLSYRGFTTYEIFEFIESVLSQDATYSKYKDANNATYNSNLSKYYSESPGDIKKVNADYLSKSFRIIATDRLVKEFPITSFFMLHSKYHDSIGVFPVKPQDSKKSDTKTQESVFYNIERIMSKEYKSSNVNKHIKNPDKLNPSFSAIMVNNPYIRLGTKNFLECATFFNCASTMEMTKSYPYFSAKLIVPTFIKERAKQILTAGTVNQFLFGDIPEDQQTDLYNAFKKEFEVTSDRDALRKGAVIDMSMFTMPQTLVNMDEELNGIGRNPYGKMPDNRLNHVQDPTQPFLTIDKFDIDVAPSAGLMSFKNATMSITLHDKSRLQDIAPLIKPDLFGAFGSEILVEYGYKHMDAINKSEGQIVNPIGEFINSSVVAEKYLIKSSNISLDMAGQVKINLGLSLKGPADLQNIRVIPNSISNDVKNDLITRQDIHNNLALPEHAISVYKYINVDSDDLAKLKKKIDNDIKVLGRRLRSRTVKGGLKPKNKEDIVKLKSATYSLKSALEARKKDFEKWTGKNEDYRNSLLGNSFGEFDPYWDYDLESKLAKQYAGKEISSFKKSRNIILESPAISNKEYVTLGNFITAIIGQKIAASNRYDDIQIVFYTANENCGYMSCRNLASMLLDKKSIERYLDGINSKNQIMTVEGLISNVIKDQVISKEHISFGLADVFKSSKKNSKDKKEDIEKKIAKRLNEIKSGKDSKDLDPEESRFVMPMIGMSFDTMSHPGKEDNKTILRVAVYDRNDNPYTSLYNIFRKSIDKEFNDKIKSLSRSYLTQSNSPDNIDKFFAKKKEVFDYLLKEGYLVKKDDNNYTLDPSKSSKGIKNVLKRNMPCITHGMESSPVTSVNVTTMEDQLLATSYIVNASKNNEARQSRFDIDIPLKIMPVQVSIDMLGFPWASFGQMYFVDFETNSTIDNVYVVTGIKHSMSQGNFTTNLNLAYQESFGTFEAAAEILDKAIDVEEKKKLISNAELGSTVVATKKEQKIITKKYLNNITINLTSTNDKTNDFYNVTNSSSDDSVSINILNSNSNTNSSKTIKFNVNDKVTKEGNNIYSNYIVNDLHFLHFEKLKTLEIKFEDGKIQNDNIFSEPTRILVPLNKNMHRGEHVSVCHTFKKDTIDGAEYYVYEPVVFLMKEEINRPEIIKELIKFFSGRFVKEDEIQKIRQITTESIANILREGYSRFKTKVNNIPDKPVKTSLYSSSLSRRKVQAISGETVARFNGEFSSEDDINAQRQRSSSRIARSKKQKIQKLASNRGIVINNYGSSDRGSPKTPRDQEILELSDYNNQVFNMNDLALRIMRYYYLTPVFNKKYHLKVESIHMTPENTASIEEFYDKADITEQSDKEILSAAFENSKRGIYDILYSDKSLVYKKTRNMNVNKDTFIGLTYIKEGENKYPSLRASKINDVYNFTLNTTDIEESARKEILALLREKSDAYNKSIDVSIKSKEHYLNYIAKSLSDQVAGGYIYINTVFLDVKRTLVRACYPYIKSSFLFQSAETIFTDRKKYSTKPNQKTANIFYIIRETKNDNGKNNYVIEKIGIYDKKIGHVVYSEDNIENITGINLSGIGKLSNETISSYKKNNEYKIKYVVPSERDFLEGHKPSDYDIDAFEISGSLFVKSSIEKEIEKWLKDNSLDPDTFYSKSYANYRVNLFRDLVDFKITKDKKYEESYKEIQEQIIAAFKKKAEEKKKAKTLKKKK
jgi:hypothetical protein